MSCINREAAIDDVKSWVGIKWYEQHLIRNVIKWLEDFPAADVIPTDWIINYMQKVSINDSVAISKMLNAWEKRDEVPRL